MRKVSWLGFLGLFILTACDLNTKPEPTQLPPIVPTATATHTAIPPTATPRPAPQVLRLHISSEPDIIDPQRAESLDEIDVVMKVFSNLLTFDSTGKLVPEMAAEVPKPSADGLSYTFKLKPGLKYSDGRPLTARDFEYGWKRQLDPEVASVSAFTGFVLAGGEAYAAADPRKVSKDELKRLRDAVGVKALDDLTLEFKLTERAPYFLSILATWNGLPTRQDLIEKNGEKWTEPATYVGNGPYLLREWQHQVRLVFVANANYTRGKPPIERIEQIVNNPSTALVAYLNGELDSVNLGPNELAQAQNDPNLSAQHTRRPGSCTFYYGFNNTKAPLDNIRVRRALAQAFDKDAYVKNFEKGLGLRADQLLPPGLPGYYADLKPLKFDPAAAKKELADAGFPNGKGLPEIRYSYAASARNQSRAEWLQMQLKDNLGLQVKLDPQDARTYKANGSKVETTPQLFLYGWCHDYPDPQDWYSAVFDSRSSTPYHAGWKHDRFDQLVRAADREPDSKKRDDLYRQAAQILLDNTPVAFLYHSAESFLVKPYVSGVKFTALDNYFSSTTLMELKILPH